MLNSICSELSAILFSSRANFNTRHFKSSYARQDKASSVGCYHKSRFGSCCSINPLDELQTARHDEHTRQVRSPHLLQYERVVTAKSGTHSPAPLLFSLEYCGWARWWLMSCLCLNTSTLSNVTSNRWVIAARKVTGHVPIRTVARPRPQQSESHQTRFIWIQSLHR